MDAEEDDQDLRLLDSAVYSLESVMFLLRSKGSFHPSIAVARTRAGIKIFCPHTMDAQFTACLAHHRIYLFYTFPQQLGIRLPLSRLGIAQTGLALRSLLHRLASVG